METCVGCGRHRGSPCGECLELLDGDIVVSRSLILEWLALLLSAGLVSFDIYLLDEMGIEPRILWMNVFFFLPAVWAVQRLTRPYRFRLRRETVEIRRVLSGSVTLPLGRVDSDLGCLVDLPRNRRFRVGEAKFPGAERFHRALRVRRARVSGVPTT